MVDLDRNKYVESMIERKEGVGKGEKQSGLRYGKGKRDLDIKAAQNLPNDLDLRAGCRRPSPSVVRTIGPKASFSLDVHSEIVFKSMNLAPQT